jgi:hypothetical protein
MTRIIVNVVGITVLEIFVLILIQLVFQVLRELKSSLFSTVLLDGTSGLSPRLTTLTPMT